MLTPVLITKKCSASVDASIGRYRYYCSKQKTLRKFYCRFKLVFLFEINIEFKQLGKVAALLYVGMHIDKIIKIT